MITIPKTSRNQPKASPKPAQKPAQREYGDISDI